MKNKVKGNTIKGKVIYLVLIFAGILMAFGQDSSSGNHKEITQPKTSAWYYSPLLWAIGAVVFILIIYSGI